MNYKMYGFFHPIIDLLSFILSDFALNKSFETKNCVLFSPSHLNLGTLEIKTIYISLNLILYGVIYFLIWYLTMNLHMV